MEETIIKQAVEKNMDAQEQVVRSVSDLVYNLSLRMLGNLADAQDASQEICLRILDKLSTFRFESEFSTWVYRLSVNYLLREREKRLRFQGLNFEIYANDLVEEHFDVPYISNVATEQLAEELKYSCSNVMLQCLDARARCVYVLGAMFHIDAKHGAAIMEMTPENFRQILSRSRQKVKGFLDNYCMVNGHCDCMRRLGHAIQTHRLYPQACEYLSLKQLPKEQIQLYTKQMEAFEAQSDLFDTLPYYQAEHVLAQVIQKLRSKEHAS